MIKGLYYGVGLNGNFVGLGFEPGMGVGGGIWVWGLLLEIFNISLPFLPTFQLLPCLFVPLLLKIALLE